MKDLVTELGKQLGGETGHETRDICETNPHYVKGLENLCFEIYHEEIAGSS